MSGDTRLSRPVSIAAALLCLWLLGALGLTVMLRLSGPWLFLPTDVFGEMVRMIGWFYVARLASFFPALYVAAIVMTRSRFNHPYLVFAGLVGGSHLVGTLLRWALKRPAWESINESAPVMAFIIELLSAVALAVVGVLFLHLNRRRSLYSCESAGH